MADQKLTKEKAAARTAKSTGARKEGGTKAGGRTAQAGKASGPKSTQAKKSAQAGKTAEKASRRDGKAEESDNKTARGPEEPLSASMKEEIALAVTLLVSVLFFLSYINLCGSVGKWLNTFIFGMVGIFGYLFPFLLFFGTAFFISNRKNRVVRRRLICTAVFFLCFAALIELLSTYDPERKWTQYFTLSAEEKNGGGILGGTLVFLLCPLFDTVATTVILIVAMIICLMIVTGREIFAYIRSMAGEGIRERGGAAERRERERYYDEEYFDEEYLDEEYLPEEGIQRKRTLIFQKPEADSAEAEKKEPVRFVDALKARGRKGKGVAAEEGAGFGAQEAVVSGVKDAAPFEEPQISWEELDQQIQWDEPGQQEHMPAPSMAEKGVSGLEPSSFYEAVRQETAQEIAGITITGDYQQEDASFYEEELERKFGGTKNDTAEVERAFYDVNVSERGTTVKENDITLIHKDLYGDEEPLIPQRMREKWPEETDKAPETEQGTAEEKEETAAKPISADMIFASAGIDPFIHTFRKRARVEEVSEAPNFSVAKERRAEEKKAEEVEAPAEEKTEPDGGEVSMPQGEVLQEAQTQDETDTDTAGIKVFAAKDTDDAGFFGASGDLFESVPPESGSTFDAAEAFFPQKSTKTDAESEFSSPNGASNSTPNKAASGAAGRTASAPSRPERRQNTPAAVPAAADILVIPPVLPVPEKKYEFPPIDLLAKPVQGKGANERELKETAAKLQNTLQSFGVRVTVTNISCGPAVTQYELQPEQGVKVNQITKLSDDIKLNLAATDIRIEAPIPGKAAVGIEVPNKENTPVILRELLESAEFKNHKSRLAFAVGKNISGQIVVSDIAKMPHMLIAGATGSGKSVCINTIIMSILYKADPKDVKLIMVDPKVVELSVYNGIPHLLIPVVTDPKKAAAALNWAVAEMTDRYQKFAALAVRDLAGYNEKVKKFDEPNPSFPPLPQIVIIVDELADLMMVASANEVEDAICRLAQMARAAGLHLIIATQRPSVNVITGVIKANVPSRVAFAVTSAVDSRTILDGVGAERLLGKGDMLFFPSGYPKPVRIQGAFVSDEEVSAVVDFLKEQAEGVNGYNEEIDKRIMSAAAGEGGGAAGSDGRDDYFTEAGRYIIEKQKASISMLQRVYKVGFNRAARIMDQLTAAGVIGPEEGTKPRKILMTQAEFEEYLGSE